MGLFSIPWWWYLPLGALALIGCVMLWFAHLRDRSRGRKRCPKCWYDLSGLRDDARPPLVCSECGAVIENVRDLFRTRRRWWLAALAVLMMLPVLGLFGYRDGKRVWYSLPPEWWTEETIRHGETVAKCAVKRDPNDRGGRVIVTHRGKTVLEVEDYIVAFGHVQWDPVKNEPAMRCGVNEDINGDGINELIVTCFSGGAHCCYMVYVLELSDPPRLVATIDAVNGMGMKRVNTEVLFNISDQSFDYWHTSHAVSPFPSVYYRLKDHHLEIALDAMPARTSLSDQQLAVEAQIASSLMQTPRPSPDAQAVRRSSANGFPEDLLVTTMLANILDLLYAGDDTRAWQHFDASWPEGVPGKEAFKAEFLEQLSRSPQWQDVQAARAAAAKGEPVPPAIVGRPRPPEKDSGTP